MVRITLDHSATIFYHRHEGLKKLIDMHKEGDIRIYHPINTDHELEEFDRRETKLFERIRSHLFGDRDISLTDHGDVCILTKHITSGRDYFVTLYPEKYGGVERIAKNVRIRFPDDEFIEEIRSIVAKRRKAKRKRASSRRRASRQRGRKKKK